MDFVSEAENKDFVRCLDDEVVLREKMDALGRLARKVAHDLNNIVTIVKGNADILQMTAGKESPFGKYIAAILTAGKRASGLAAQLSSLNEKKTLKPVPIDLNGLVRSLEPRIRGILPKGVEFVLNDAPTALLFLGDRVGAEEIVMSLVKNACDSMREGGRLTITTEASEGRCPDNCLRESGKDWVVLSVRDTGQGISDEVKGRIFEPFFTTKAKGEADGLGLSRVYALVRAADGFIRFQSTVGEGSCFFVGFPAAVDQGGIEAA